MEACVLQLDIEIVMLPYSLLHNFKKVGFGVCKCIDIEFYVCIFRCPLMTD